ncbi:hypothetical protein CPC08DRAFT_354175 [Agrocybe pediades]|nr:hypothetical protein CPC08DRAFT_354175 [Agrocybe pediades]
MDYLTRHFRKRSITSSLTDSTDDKASDVMDVIFVVSVCLLCGAILSLVFLHWLIRRNRRRSRNLDRDHPTYELEIVSGHENDATVHKTVITEMKDGLDEEVCCTETPATTVTMPMSPVPVYLYSKSCIKVFYQTKAL